MENGVLTDSVTYFVEEIKNKHEIDLKSITVDKAVPSKEFLVLLDSVRLRRQFGCDISEEVVLKKIDNFLQKENFTVSYKLFNDPIFGNIKVHPVAQIIIDTPQFQRLRHIKQLSSLSYVYPGATGTRFDHSLGVYHLAGELVSTLRDKQPELELTKIDCLCVQLAGLCHDLGHGPFSHLFEVIVNSLPGTSRKVWQHENNSIKMLDHIYSNSDTRRALHSWGICDEDIEFIKALMRGESDHVDSEKTGRDDSKSFLYQIVANKENGMDVDKWDYLARDAHYLGIKINFEYQRLLYHLRVMEVSGRPQICVRDKEADSVFNLYSTRYSLHKQAYQHPVGRAVELMIKDAIVAAAPHLRIRGKSLLECLDDMERYTLLTDSIFYKILDSEEIELAGARHILERLQKRKLYKCVEQAEVSNRNGETPEGLRNQLANELGGTDFTVSLTIRHFGKENANPLDSIWFYKKQDLVQPFQLTKEQKSLLTPVQFQDKALTAFCKAEVVKDEHYERVREVFDRYNLLPRISHG